MLSHVRWQYGKNPTGFFINYAALYKSLCITTPSTLVTGMEAAAGITGAVSLTRSPLATGSWRQRKFSTIIRMDSEVMVMKAMASETPAITAPITSTRARRILTGMARGTTAMIQ